MWEQVRMFTPDKVKYADQLFGAAEVPWTSPSPLLFSSRRHQKARTHAHTYPHTQVQAELQQQQQSLFQDFVNSGYAPEELVAGPLALPLPQFVCNFRHQSDHRFIRPTFSVMFHSSSCSSHVCSKHERLRAQTWQILLAPWRQSNFRQTTNCCTKTRVTMRLHSTHFARKVAALPDNRHLMFTDSNAHVILLLGRAALPVI